MTDFKKGVLTNTFAQRAQFHADGSVSYPAARTGADVNPNATLDNTAEITPAPTSTPGMDI